MKYSVIFLVLFVIVFCTHVSVYATIETTQFDLKVFSKYFYEPNTNRYHLVMKPGDSQQVTIQITNNDSTPQTIDLQMSKDDFMHKQRIFVFEPAQLEIKPQETATSILTVSANPDASTGTTILHTLIAKSTTFGAKAFGFYVGVDDKITSPSPDPIRRGSPGSMFASQTQFDIDEIDAINKIPYNILAPDIPDEYMFRGMYGLDHPEQLIYSKQPVSLDTGEINFWDNGGLLINFFEEKYLTYDDYLKSLDSNEQQVRINGKKGIASGSLLISSPNDQKTYSDSQVTIFLDDVLLRITSQMPLEQILRIAESMIDEQYMDEFTGEQICGPEPELINGKCSQIITEKSSRDDAPFFGIFVYLDDLLSWILGK